MSARSRKRRRAWRRELGPEGFAAAADARLRLAGQPATLVVDTGGGPQTIHLDLCVDAGRASADEIAAAINRSLSNVNATVTPSGISILQRVGGQHVGRVRTVQAGAWPRRYL